MDTTKTRGRREAWAQACCKGCKCDDCGFYNPFRGIKKYIFLFFPCTNEAKCATEMSAALNSATQHTVPTTKNTLFYTECVQVLYIE